VLICSKSKVKKKNKLRLFFFARRVVKLKEKKIINGVFSYKNYSI